MLKMGTYGFLRFAIPMFPQAAVDLAPILLVLAVIGIIYGAIVAAMQTEPEAHHRLLVGRAPRLRRARHLRAHEPGHLGRRCSRCCRHGLTTGALFLLVGMLYDRRHTYELADFRGIWKVGAGVRRPVRRGDVRVDRPARLLRLRRRVPVAARRVPHEPLVRGRRDDRRDPRRGLPAVGGAARVHRRARRARTRRRRDIGFRELVHGRAAARPVAVPRLLPEAGARPARSRRCKRSIAPRRARTATTAAERADDR